MAASKETMDCPGDETLLRFAQGEFASAELEALESHFDACPDCRALAGWACRSEGGQRNMAPASGALVPGARLGRYVIERMAGAGSMGTVYAAHDRSSTAGSRSSCFATKAKSAPRATSGCSARHGRWRGCRIRTWCRFSTRAPTTGGSSSRWS